MVLVYPMEHRQYYKIKQNQFDMSDQSLHDFVTTNTLPARVKVTEGLYNTDQVEWEFSNGDVLDLHRLVCPSVQLQFVHPDSGEEKTISVSTQSPCLFKIMPYIPDQAIHINRAMVIHGTTELIRIWPSVVCTRSAYVNAISGIIICKGEKLRLKRLLHKDGQFLLECSRQNAQLVLLPLTCDLEYLLVEDTTAYTLAEIADMQGRVERRLRLSEDSVNKSQFIPGIPRDFVGDVIMAPPQRFVEIHPADSPGEEIVAPIDIDISVSDREVDYIGLAFRWYPLEQFVSVNKSKFPMVVAIADWDEEPVSVQAIRASIGDRIVLFNPEQVLKVACQVADSFFIIPLTYDVAFEAKPRIFSSIEDVCTNKIKKVKVIRDVTSRLPGFSNVHKGEVLTIISTKRDGNTSGTVTVNKEGIGVVQLSMTLRGEYQEVLNLPKGSRLTLKEINPSVLPLTVIFRDPSASIPPRMDRLARDEDILILFMFRDNCVRASKNMERGFSAPIPTRANISVRYISQYKRTHAPETSALSICPEEITEEKLVSLETMIMYENVESIPEEEEPPELKPRTGFGESSALTLNRLAITTGLNNQSYGLTTSRDGVPLPGVPGSRPTSKMTSSFGRAGLGPPPPAPVKRSISAPSPKVPPRPGQTRGHGNTRMFRPVPSAPLSDDHDCAIEDEIEYEDVGDLRDYNAVMKYIFGVDEPPSITTPADANISMFTWQEMIVFLQLTAMPPRSLRLFASDQITGSQFAALDNSKLSAYGVNFPIIRHYRNKSKPRPPVVHFL